MRREEEPLPLGHDGVVMRGWLGRHRAVV